jgi:hypothetical protein
MPMNALKKEEVIPEEVAQDLADPVNLQTNREFRVVLTNVTSQIRSRILPIVPPLNLWLTIRHAVLLESAQ